MTVIDEDQGDLIDKLLERIDKPVLGPIRFGMQCVAITGVCLLLGVFLLPMWIIGRIVMAVRHK